MPARFLTGNIENRSVGAKAVAEASINKALSKRGQLDYALIKASIKDELSKYIFRETKRRPMILPIIM